MVEMVELMGDSVWKSVVVLSVGLSLVVLVGTSVVLSVGLFVVVSVR